MKIKFIKDHISGIKKGRECEMKDNHAKRLIKEGFAEEAKAKKEKKKK